MAGAAKHIRINDDEGFEEDLANFLGENHSTEEEGDTEDESRSEAQPKQGNDQQASFWNNKAPDLPEKFPLDHVNVETLVNMISKIHLVWPEDLPYYDELEYSMDPQRAKLPSSFYHNTDKEKVVLWYAENFRRQFMAKFPDRRPPVIAPKNECGCQKLFPTYINPTALGYPEFLDCVTTVEFLKDFFSPAILSPPTRFPDRVRSHYTVIKRRKANAFEIAAIIVSILLGSGYDAYVVDGFASKTICTIDTSLDYTEPVEKPLLDYEIEPETDTDNKKDFDHFDYGFFNDKKEENVFVPVSPSKYRFKRKGVSAMDATEGAGGELGGPSGLRTSFQQPGRLSVDDDSTQAPEGAEEDEEEGTEMDEGEYSEGAQREAAEVFDELPANAKDRYHGKRTHAWILVLAGKRDVEESFFLEPFSGTSRAIKDPNFLGIEAIFNHKNYWINIQPPTKNLKQLKYDLDDQSCWSKFLMEPEKKKKRQVEHTEQPPGGGALFQEEEEDDSGAKTGELYLTMPVSWTGELEISQEDYERKYPDGSRTIEYNDASVEVAAPYTNPDGMVRKVMKFSGTSRDPEDLEYIEEFFEHRKDKLSRRKWYREGKILHEYFNQGRKDALKEHVHVSGRNKPDYPRDLYYYSNSHPRSVSHRQIIKKGMIEHFEDREDKLYYKLILFGGILCNTIPTKADEQRSKARHIVELVKGAGVGGSGSKNRARRKIIKIVEKYHRYNGKDANEDIAEKHMLIDEGRLRILFHYNTGNLTRNSLEFFKTVKTGQSKYAPVEFKPEDCIEYQSDRNAEPIDVYKKFNLLRQMDRDERASIVQSREAEDEVFQTVSSRVQEDWRHEVEPDAYAGDRNEEYMKMMREQQASADNLDEYDQGTDLTTPFFEKYGVPRNKRDEILMKKRIMLHEKVKILRRAHMIKELYDKASSTLREKQEWYIRHLDQLNPTQEEDFNHMYKERLFQMHILEQRMIRHQQETPRQYYELLVQLLRHPQLNRFTNKKVPPPAPPPKGLSPEERTRIAKELAKLKDCCQFYSIRYSEKKGRKKQMEEEAARKKSQEEALRKKCALQRRKTSAGGGTTSASAPTGDDDDQQPTRMSGETDVNLP